MKVDERVDDPRPWKKRVFLPRSSAVVGQISHHYNVRKHLAGSNHLKVQAVSGLWVPTSTKRTPVVQRPCTELKWRLQDGLGGKWVVLAA